MVLADATRVDHSEPVVGNFGEQAALAWDGRGHNNIERGEAIGGDDEEAFAAFVCVGEVGEAVDVANLATAKALEVEVGVEEGIILVSEEWRERICSRLWRWRGNHRAKRTPLGPERIGVKDEGWCVAAALSETKRATGAFACGTLDFAMADWGDGPLHDRVL